MYVETGHGFQWRCHVWLEEGDYSISQNEDWYNVQGNKTDSWGSHPVEVLFLAQVFNPVEVLFLAQVFPVAHTVTQTHMNSNMVLN